VGQGRAEIHGLPELMRTLERIDDTLQTRTQVEMVKAAAGIVASRMRQLAPSSAKTGTRERWSRKVREQREGEKPIAETIDIVVRGYGPRTLCLVGPGIPAGVLINVLYGEEHGKIAWGEPTGRTEPGNRFVQQAFDETEAQQQAAMQAVVQRTLQEIGA
jgi:hypothetical protein